jgi:hypothetical protein
LRQNRNGHQKRFRFAGDRRPFEIEIQQVQVPGQGKELSSVGNPIEAERNSGHLVTTIGKWGDFFNVQSAKLPISLFHCRLIIVAKNFVPQNGILDLPKFWPNHSEN